MANQAPQAASYDPKNPEKTTQLILWPKTHNIIIAKIHSFFPACFLWLGGLGCVCGDDAFPHFLPPQIRTGFPPYPSILSEIQFTHFLRSFPMGRWAEGVVWGRCSPSGVSRSAPRRAPSPTRRRRTTTTARCLPRFSIIQLYFFAGRLVIVVVFVVLIVVAVVVIVVFIFRCCWWW